MPSLRIGPRHQDSGPSGTGGAFGSGGMPSCVLSPCSGRALDQRAAPASSSPSSTANQRSLPLLMTESSSPQPTRAKRTAVSAGPSTRPESSRRASFSSSPSYGTSSHAKP